MAARFQRILRLVVRLGLVRGGIGNPYRAAIHPKLFYSEGEGCLALAEKTKYFSGVPIVGVAPAGSAG